MPLSFHQLPQGSKAWFKDLDKRIKQNPKDAYSIREKSVWFIKTGDYVSAYSLLKEAVDLNPRISLGYRGWLKLYKLHDYKGAIEDLNELHNSFGKFYAWGENIFLLIGLAYKGLGLYFEAIQSIKKSIKVDIERKKLTPYHYIYLGICHKLQGDEISAMEYLLKSLECGVLCAELFYQLALLDICKRKRTILLEISKNLVLNGYFRKNPYKDYPNQLYLTEINCLLKAAN